MTMSTEVKDPTPPAADTSRIGLPRRLDTDQPLSSRKLNVGCGFNHAPGYVNIDLQDFHAPEVVADVRDLHMLPSRSFDEVQSRDVIEHFEWRDTPRALYEWNRLLVDGGRLFVSTTYLTGLLRRLTDNTYSTVRLHKLLIVNLFSMQKYTGDYHYTAFTERLIRFYLWETGFEIESIEVLDGWLFHIWAKKIKDYSCADLIADSQSDEHFIASMYRTLLGRDPDAASAEIKLQSLVSRSTNRAQVAKQFLNCEEREEIMMSACPDFGLSFDTA